MKRNESITRVMTSDVVSVQKGQPLSSVAEVLREHDFRHVPVLDGTTPVGMISATDVFKLLYDHDGTDSRMAAAILDHEHTIEGTMSSELSTLPDSATVFDAVERLSDPSHSSVLVVDQAGAMAGLVTTIDLIRYLRDQY